jgi:hypothetical protein
MAKYGSGRLVALHIDPNGEPQMQTLVVIWWVGGIVCGIAYLVSILLQFRTHSPTAGVLSDVFHFGTRPLLLFVLWPVFVVAFVYSGIPGFEWLR